MGDISIFQDRRHLEIILIFFISQNLMLEMQ